VEEVEVVEVTTATVEAVEEVEDRMIILLVVRSVVAVDMDHAVPLPLLLAQRVSLLTHLLKSPPPLLLAPKRHSPVVSLKVLKVT
jgi:hypothetical protein